MLITISTKTTKHEWVLCFRDHALCNSSRRDYYNRVADQIEALDPRTLAAIIRRLGSYPDYETVAIAVLKRGGVL